jgi:hypothetical protein
LARTDGTSWRVDPAPHATGISRPIHVGGRWWAATATDLVKLEGHAWKPVASLPAGFVAASPPALAATDAGWRLLGQDGFLDDGVALALPHRDAQLLPTGDVAFIGDGDVGWVDPPPSTRIIKLLGARGDVVEACRGDSRVVLVDGAALRTTAEGWDLPSPIQGGALACSGSQVGVAGQSAPTTALLALCDAGLACTSWSIPGTHASAAPRPDGVLMYVTISPQHLLWWDGTAGEVRTIDGTFAGHTLVDGDIVRVAER